MTANMEPLPDMNNEDFKLLIQTFRHRDEATKDNLKNIFHMYVEFYNVARLAVELDKRPHLDVRVIHIEGIGWHLTSCYSLGPLILAASDTSEMIRRFDPLLCVCKWDIDNWEMNLRRLENAASARAVADDPTKKRASEQTSGQRIKKQRTAATAASTAYDSSSSSSMLLRGSDEFDFATLTSFPAFLTKYKNQSPEMKAAFESYLEKVHLFCSLVFITVGLNKPPEINVNLMHVFRAEH